MLKYVGTIDLVSPDETDDIVEILLLALWGKVSSDEVKEVLLSEKRYTQLVIATDERVHYREEDIANEDGVRQLWFSGFKVSSSHIEEDFKIIMKGQES